MLAVSPLCVSCAEVLPAGPADATRRLLIKLGAEPLIVFYTDDARALPAKASATYLNKALHDPSYDRGLATLRALIHHGAGADIVSLWPDFSKLISGPVALAMLPGDVAKPGDPPFKLVLAVVTPSAEMAEKLNTLWPKVAPQSNTLFSALRLLTVLPEDLPAAGTQPLPAGDVVLRMQPRKISAMVEKWLEDETDTQDPLDEIMPVLSEIIYEEIEELSLSMKFSGLSIQDELRLTAYVNPDPQQAAESVFARVLEAIKEKPAVFDSLLAATPGEQDMVLMGQLQLSALGENLPFAAQSLERYLRGRKWARGTGIAAEALNANRFRFLFDRLQGSFALAGKPALSGDLRLTMATAMNSGDVQSVKKEVIKGMGEVGAEFESLEEARKIGGVSPLGALFRGRGMFGAPVLGLSPGWIWLCSNSGAYQDLTGAFKAGKTLAVESKKNGTDFWRASDAVRVQIELEKITRLAYAAWLVSGEEGLFIRSWKVPAELLPQPQVFNGLGSYRAGITREGRTVSITSSSSLPGGSLLLAMLLQRSAQQIEFARYLSRRALSEQLAPNAPLLPPVKNARTDPRPAPPTLEGIPPKIDLQEKP